METNVAIIVINEEVLLSYLQFSGGKIYSIHRDTNEWQPKTLKLVIEHPDLPKVSMGDTLPQVAPAYILETVCQEGKLYTRMVRVDPKDTTEERLHAN